MHKYLVGASMSGALALVPMVAGGVSQAATPSTASLEAVHPAMQQILRYGSRGHWVATLQANLIDLGYTKVEWVDGIFGPKTEAGLKAFERQHGFQPTGVTSPAVWQDMLAGFGLMPSFNGVDVRDTAVIGRAASPSSTQATAASTTIGTSTNSTGSVLPASFPTGGTPVGEPSLSSTAAGIQGQFSSSVKTIDGRPVLAAYHMVATSYGPSLADNYPYGPTDAFGQPLEDGMVAVDPSVIPLHSVVYVTGYKDNFLPSGGFLGQAMDTGGAIKGDRIDIFMNHGSNVISDFGVQQVTVYRLGN